MRIALNPEMKYVLKVMDFCFNVSILVEICKIDVKILQKVKVVNIIKNFLTLQKICYRCTKNGFKKDNLKAVRRQLAFIIGNEITDKTAGDCLK